MKKKSLNGKRRVVAHVFKCLSATLIVILTKSKDTIANV